jgi:ribosome-binding protein aMBF1 (putative translation factor)
MCDVSTIKLGKTEYVILSKIDYLKLRDSAGIPAGSVNAIPYARASIGSTLKAAREHARLTQADLAKSIGKSQSMVSGAESGAISVSTRYVSAVLKACGLAPDWTGPGHGARRKRR